VVLDKIVVNDIQPYCTTLQRNVNSVAMKSIETKRLKLRQWQESDFSSFAQYYADEDNARYVGGQKNPEQAWRHMALQIGHWKLKGFGYWAVDEKETNDFVGCVGLWQSPGWPELELGYWLMKEHQGKGYALEACLRCIDYAREVLKASSLVSYIDPGNAPSIRLAERLGAVNEGTIELLSYGPHCVFRHF
jgi:RimJ/RimL family protein N-acetyltransferase